MKTSPKAFGTTQIAVKYGPTIPLSSDHDFTIENHSSVFADDCHCQGFHWFCTHTVIDAFRRALGITPEDNDGN